MKQILSITDKDIIGEEGLSKASPRIAADAILFNEDNNIALSYIGKYDFYTLPGGGVEPGEDLTEGLKREILEETGYNCEIIEVLGMSFENRARQDFTQERTYFVARIIGEEGPLNLTALEIEEETKVVWVPLKQAIKLVSEKRHDNYQRKFIQARDAAALNEALNRVGENLDG